MSQLLCEEQVEEIAKLLEEDEDFEEYQANLQERHEHYQKQKEEFDV